LKSYLKKGDIILCIALLSLSILGIILPVLSAKDGTSLTVSINGELYTKMPLSTDTILDIIQDDGVISNTLVITNGQASISHATCFNQLCVAQVPISSTNETIVCLPNKVILEISNGSDTFIDSISE